ncbi:hypothetical protein KC19_VG018100 [Ceratodon purpureus]|uniref:Uncharacterized protein n=1 Tax=Ceratodon purpureus TaxID=3225 RepID=A0A8T0HLD8_CERPU|nr:hypothetical protein KC19_VG018100 [Ceratodon purpureus]
MFTPPTYGKRYVKRRKERGHSRSPSLDSDYGRHSKHWGSRGARRDRYLQRSARRDYSPEYEYKKGLRRRRDLDNRDFYNDRRRRNMDRSPSPFTLPVRRLENSLLNAGGISSKMAEVKSEGAGGHGRKSKIQRTPTTGRITLSTFQLNKETVLRKDRRQREITRETQEDQHADFAFVPVPNSNGVASSGSTTSPAQLCAPVGHSVVSQSTDSIGPMSSTAGGSGVAAVTQSGKSGDA